MSCKYTFVTKKLYSDNSEKIIIKNGYMPNLDVMKNERANKRIKKKKELESLKNINIQLKMFNETPKEKFNKTILDYYNKKYENFKKEFAPKIENSIRSMNRAKNNVLDILKNNDFNFFVTLTFNNKNDRLNDDITRKLFSKWTNNVTKQLPNMTYIAVPEYHKKGGLHFHLLLGNVTSEELKLVDSGLKVKSGRCSDQTIFNVTKWKYGFSTATAVIDKNAVKYYLSKYLTKGKIDIRFFNKKRYYVSKNITRPDIEKYIVPLSEDFNIYDSIIKENYNIDYEDKQKEYCVLSSKLGG